MISYLVISVVWTKHNLQNAYLACMQALGVPIVSLVQREHSAQQKDYQYTISVLMELIQI